MRDIFKKIINFIIDHCWAIALSFLLTILIFSPLLALPVALKNDYQGINIIPFGTDAHGYLSRAREVLDGHGLGSYLLKEGKDQADSFLSYGDYILLAPVKLLGLAQKVNIVTLYNSYAFVGVWLLIILIYFFALKLSGNKLLSITAALFAVGGYSLVYHKALFYSDFNVYARLIYPYLSSLVLFAYLNLLFTNLSSDRLKYKIFAGMAFGLMFYLYFYLWSFTLALNASLLLILLLKKDFLSAKKVFLISLVGLALGSYNLFRLLAALNSEFGGQLSFFNCLSYGHGPIFSKIGFITLVILAIFWYQRKNERNIPLIAAVILAGWVSLNQQIISGRMLEYGHYYFYFIVPLSIIISFYMVWQLIKNESLKKYLFILLIAIVFINTAGGQYKSFSATLEANRYQQNFRPIIDFLNREREPRVILTDEDRALLFTIYTPHDLFWHIGASQSRVPLQRFKEAFFVYSYLNKNSRNNFSDYILEMMANNNDSSYYKADYKFIEGFSSGYDYYEYKNKVGTDDQYLRELRSKLVEQLSQEYNEVMSKNDGINQLLKKYEVNYVVWDKNTNPEWDFGSINGLKQVIAYNNIYLYSMEN